MGIELFWMAAAQAGAEGGQAAGPPPEVPAFSSLITLALIFGVFYFLLIRPQQKARKEQERLIASVKTGDRVVTSGGLLGTVTNVKDKTVLIRVAENVKVEVLKSSLTSVTKGEAEAK
ncbi:SecYEG protein translocase auxillary subunit [Methylacidimicrobium sp. AP8]|uniref:preprotein translocase subunit YajC n=1 Tax=Methylacidimicrobium sp. AP8 TaxID=2730359 RepID=UPI0018C0F6DA|nr:preprotein translocase subunit YajC [Methylacidimicrobium sp. AP8]CAB4244366.1 SecYEG protein translocase auxillary subunit [Methylacidimicrobium sp. AP8]